MNSPGACAKPAALEQLAHGGEIGSRHRLHVRIGAERADLAAHVDHRLVQRIAEPLARVAADDHAARLRHERREAADVAADDDVRALQRDAAAQPGIAANDQQPAVRRGAGAAAREAAHLDRARHHVLGDARAGVAVRSTTFACLFMPAA